MSDNEIDSDETDGINTKKSSVDANGEHHADRSDDAADNGQSSDTGAADDEDQADATDGADRPSREAAKYRRRLRATEAERDQLRDRVEALQRAEVERIAEAEQLRPAALWASSSLPDLLGEDGTVDAAKVTDAIAAARSTLGLPAPRRNHVPLEGRNPSASGSTSDSMIDAVMGRSG